MKLYEINQSIADILNNLEEVEDKTLYEVMTGALESLEIAKNDKLDNIASYIKSLNAEVAAFKEEEKNLAERRKAKENKVKQLEEFLYNSLKVDGTNKLESTRNIISIRKTPAAVKIDNEQVFIFANEFSDLVTSKTTLSIDKMAIKKALKDGEIIEGASLVTGEKISIK